MRSLLDDAFDGDFSDDDWDHALGGVHVLAERDGQLVGHAAVVPRTLRLDGDVMSCGYVEAVAVASSARREGLGVALMREVDTLVSAYDIGVLAATAAGAPLYAATGWVVWTRQLAVRSADDVVTPTPDDRGAVMVHGGPAVIAAASDDAAVLTVDDRPGDVW